MGKVIRFQFEIDQEHMNELESLMKLGGLKTKKELLNNALTLLKWVVKQTGRGSTIAAMDERDGTVQRAVDAIPGCDCRKREAGRVARRRIGQLDSRGSRTRTCRVACVPCGFEK